MTNETPEDVEALMQQMNQSAFEVASRYDVTLDYSDESVKGVESILGQIHKDFKKTKDETGMAGISLFFAAYLGEVIRRKGLGGSWQRNHPTVGDDSFPFEWKGTDLFLYGWCLKRIFDGKQDNIWSKYQACVLAELPS